MSKPCNWAAWPSWSWRWPCIWSWPGAWRAWSDLSASALLTEAEWKGACILAKKKPPTQPPTIREVIRQIAMLGGFLGRKCDGQPGVKSLWLGFARVRDFVQGVEHMRLLQDAGGSCV
ncbi:IS4 family transposase [Verminephrobacter eiseniae]|uniref:IS4 family transposase n=1 Tax=Verminephrobacter eiseniae TaxID=364317 RepID=UPI0038B3A61A